MYKIKKFGLILGLLIGSTLAQADAKKELQAYPAAEAGFIRQVIFLPTLKNEDNAKVELIIGKTMDTDCNTRGLAATIQEKTVTGWGYNYLLVDKVSSGPTTMMACPDNSKQKRFVSVYGVALQRYNSKLPLVVYTPADVQVKYRIWRPEARTQQAQKK